VKRFAFKLQKALDIRAYKERETEIALGRAVSAQAEIENRLKALARDLLNAEENRFDAGNAAVDMRAWDRYITRLEDTREELLQEAAAAAMRTEEARAAYIEASRERKALDKLKEKQQKLYRKEALADEVKTLDDITGGKFRSARADGGAARFSG
jgi:flagellar FliJ protein